MKSCQKYREHKYNFEILHPTQPKRSGEVEVFSRMVYHMGSPPKPLMVRHVMCPIAAKIIKNIAWQKGPPTKNHAPGQQVVNGYSQAENQKLNGSTDKHIAKANQNRTKGFLLVIISFVLELRNTKLYQYAEKHEGCCPGNKVWCICIVAKQFIIRNRRSTKKIEKKHGSKFGPEPFRCLTASFEIFT